MAGWAAGPPAAGPTQLPDQNIKMLKLCLIPQHHEMLSGMCQKETLWPNALASLALMITHSLQWREDPYRMTRSTFGRLDPHPALKYVPQTIRESVKTPQKNKDMPI